jgi:antidote-toxin recognition MazE-like antitoxin
MIVVRSPATVSLGDRPLGHAIRRDARARHAAELSGERFALRRPARRPGRPKAQLTLPEEIKRALHLSEGDEMEFAVHGDGTITVRGYVSIPADQAWFFTPQWLAGEQRWPRHLQLRCPDYGGKLRAGE